MLDQQAATTPTAAAASPPSPLLRLLTWNVNGVRSLGGCGSFGSWLTGQAAAADIICLQETKITRDMLTEQLALVPGFTSYFAFSKARGGYSGVATYCRTAVTPVAAEEGITGLLGAGLLDGVRAAEDLRLEFSPEELKSLDSEGRCVITSHQLDNSSSNSKARELVVINVYCPRADPDRPDRARYKLHFYRALDIRANRLRAKGHHVVIVGDINTSHKEIDHCDPYEEFHDHPGRRFLNHFLQPPHLLGSEASSVEAAERVSPAEEEEKEDWQTVHVSVEQRQFVDTFRIFHPDRKLAFTCWNTKMNCRSTNYGTRIDYILASRCLVFPDSLVASCNILPEVVGSDHCPVLAEFNLRISPASKAPSSATKFYPELQGRQVSIKNMLTAAAASGAGGGVLPPPNKRELAPSIINPTSAQAKKVKTATSAAKITQFFAPKSDQKTKILDERSCMPDAVMQMRVESCTQNVPGENYEFAGIAESYAAASLVKNEASKAAWGALFRPPPPAPLCSGHREEAVKRRVTKKGPNLGREFYACRRGEGRSDDPAARCDFFKWAK